ncbi:2822_t:CDS:2 [Cetraspora pellucida]|uniref:2822_t:CDS:1 n=1 Tax=Cetraspora pellucida TaxID=1433469 RepID=A0A9N9HZV9_9GLOM|nr:2822_t:CDS:2 [Cetraspora pellucida]
MLSLKLFILICLILLGSSTVLGNCGGTLTIPKSVPNNTSAIVSVTDQRLARCQCNTQYYQNLTRCLDCYRVNNIGNISVANVNDYKSACTSLGVPFTDSSAVQPDPTAGAAKRVLIGVIVGLVGLMLIGVGGWLYWRKSKSHPKLDSEPPPDLDHHQYDPPAPISPTDANTEVVQPTLPTIPPYGSSQPEQYFGGGVPPSPPPDRYGQYGQYYSNQPSPPPGQQGLYGGAPPGTSSPPQSQHPSYYSVSSSQPILSPSSGDDATGRYSQQYSSGQFGGIPEQEQTSMPLPLPTPVGYQQHGYPIQYQQGYPPSQQGYPSQGFPPHGHGYPPQGYPSQGYPSQGYPPQGYPQGYPPQGNPQGYPLQRDSQGYPLQRDSQNYPPSQGDSQGQNPSGN